MNRNNVIRELESLSGTKWDVLVIGGGATGLGIAVDSVTRGYKTLLLEQSDFAKGTSSRSTKLVHGGVRYMAQGDLLLVMEACRERGILLKNAPHLTFNQEFIIPVYSYFDVLKYTGGLKFYDLLAGRLSMGKSYFINKEKTIEKLPLLKKIGLKGGIVYHDGQFDDSRLAITLADVCSASGGYVLNYCTVNGLLKESGKISGVTAFDNSTGRKLRFNANLVINATGVFADEIAKMDDIESEPTIRPSQGVHIVLDKSFLGGNSAIMIPKTDDGRVLFAIPWYDAVVVGTTDTPLNVISLEPVALEKEISFILKTAGDYLIRKPDRKDVLCIFAGLRPLAADNGNNGSTKEVSRRHRITVSPSGLVSIVGGKWTTYRMMAEETIDTAIKKGFLEKKECVTKSLKLDSEKTNLSDRLHIYGGKGAEQIRKLISGDSTLGERIDPRLPYSRAEIIWICRNEMPYNLEDLLARRMRALFLNARASIEMAPVTAAIMATELGNDTEWQESQVREFTQLALNYL